MTCAKCGAKNEDYARYCWNCGTPTHVSRIKKNNPLRFLNHEWLGLTQVVPKLLYLGALCIFGIYLFRAIYILIDWGTSASDILIAVSCVAGGLFYIGILVGFAGVTSTQIDAAQKKRLRKFLYIAAACLLITAIAVLAFSMFYEAASLYTSITLRLYYALPAFAYIGLFASGILAGLGTLNSPWQETDSQGYNPVINILYAAAVATVIIGIITASLSVAIKDESYSNLDKTFSFLSNFAQDGIFLGSILAALGRLAALRNRKSNAPDSTDEDLDEDEEEEEEGASSDEPSAI